VRIELRGTIRVALGSGSIDLPLPEGGVPLHSVLDRLALEYPRAGRYLQQDTSAYRVVLNGAAVDSGSDPLVEDSDSLLLLWAVAGG
jgi:hypothetical protein